MLVTKDGARSLTNGVPRKWVVAAGAAWGCWGGQVAKADWGHGLRFKAETATAPAAGLTTSRP